MDSSAALSDVTSFAHSWSYENHTIGVVTTYCFGSLAMSTYATWKEADKIFLVPWPQVGLLLRECSFFAWAYPFRKLTVLRLPTSCIPDSLARSLVLVLYKYENCIVMLTLYSSFRIIQHAAGTCLHCMYVGRVDTDLNRMMWCFSLSFVFLYISKATRTSNVLTG